MKFKQPDEALDGGIQSRGPAGPWGIGPNWEFDAEVRSFGV